MDETTTTDPTIAVPQDGTSAPTDATASPAPAPALAADPAPASDAAPADDAAPAPAPGPALVFNYDPGTFVYLGASVADIDPLEGTPQLPAFATFVASPTQVPTGQVAVFDPEAGAWNIASASIFVTAPPPAPAPDLQQLKDASQAALDVLYQQLYDLAVPNPAIAREYDCAYWSAEDWLDAGMPDPVPARIAALAETTSTEEAPVTPEDAANLVVQKWKQAADVLDRRGAERLRAKAAIRAATDPAGVFEAEAAGRAAMQAITYTI